MLALSTLQGHNAVCEVCVELCPQVDKRNKKQINAALKLIEATLSVRGLQAE